jgi:hypothetical protein
MRLSAKTSLSSPETNSMSLRINHFLVFQHPICRVYVSLGDDSLISEVMLEFPCSVGNLNGLISGRIYWKPSVD